MHSHSRSMSLSFFSMHISSDGYLHSMHLGLNASLMFYIDVKSVPHFKGRTCCLFGSFYTMYMVLL